MLEVMIALAVAATVIAAFVAGVYVGAKLSTDSPPRLPSLPTKGGVRVLDSGVYLDDIEG